MLVDASQLLCGKKRAGFTLVELLVTISVLAVLITLLSSAIPAALASSRSAKCAGKLRNIGSGLAAYISDHEGKLIPAAVVQSGYFWFDVLNPYMGHKTMEWSGGKVRWADGSEVDPDTPLPWQLCPAKPVVPLNRQTVGYGWNRTFFGHTWQDSYAYTGNHTRLSEVLKPSRTIIIGDSMDHPTAASHSRYLFQNNTGYPLSERHRGAGNYLFLDGHVESLTPEFLKTKEGQDLFRKDR